MKNALTTPQLYAAAIGIAFLISVLATPAVRAVAVAMRWLDYPSSSVKTHKEATPVLGGVAIWLAFAGSLVILRFLTHFPTGTLYRLRSLLAGGAMVFLLGFVDDMLRPRGLDWKTKIVVQIVAAAMLIYFGIQVRFLHPEHLANLITILWVVGICNAFNIIDIMDGLAASQAVIAALALLLIALPSEEVYVNFGAAALAGAALGFLPWNLSRRRKIFMGDSGSLLLGFSLAGLTLGTDYTKVNNWGVYAPLFIVAVPMFDTLYVMVIRMMKGQSPFTGSKDHFALRLERMGFKRPQILLLCLLASGFLSVCAWLVTLVSASWAVWIYLVVGSWAAIVAWHITKVDMG